MALSTELSHCGISLDLETRIVSDDQMRRYESYMAEIFAAFRMDVGSPATADTPRRFLRSLYDATGGYDGDPKLMTVFDSEYDGIVDRANQIVEGPIRFYALCEHHALPFFGEAHVGYIAGDRIVGISKLVRLVRVFARRFTLQERLGQQIAEALESMVEPLGVAVYIEASHLCTQMRGVQDSSPLTRTSCWRGMFNDDPALRAEFLQACHRGR